MRGKACVVRWKGGRWKYLQRTQVGVGEGNSTPLRYACLENPMDGGAWWAAVHGVAKSWTRLRNFTFLHWRRKWQPTPVFLPGESQGRGEPGGLPAMGSHRVGHDGSDFLSAPVSTPQWS